MTLHFSKMQALGNDFVVIDATATPFNLTPSAIAKLADRQFGIGCDQVLVIEPPQTPETDFFYRIFNANGNEVGQCGNGVRCLGRYVTAKQLTEKKQLTIQTSTTIMTVDVEDDLVTVDMGKARIDNTSAELPVTPPVRASLVDIGNPHCIITVESVAEAPVDSLGPQIESHALFPDKINVGFMEVVDRGHVRLRVYERDAGETLACGSGACAAVAAGVAQGVLDNQVTVSLPGGDLVIAVGSHIQMTGPANFVFEGYYTAL